MSNIESGRQPLVAPSVTLARVVEQDQRPRVGLAGAHERLVPVVAVLEEQPPIPVLGEQWGWFPAVLEARFHRADVPVPVARFDRALCLAFGAGEAHEIVD